MLRPAPGVREDERRAVLVDQLAEEVVHPSVRHLHRHGGHVADGAEDREVEVLPRVDLDDGHVADLSILVPRKELRLLLDRRNGGAQADPDEISPGLLAETLQANRQQRTALRGADLVNLVEDDPLDVREVFPELRRAQDDRDALRRCDEDMRRVADLPLSFLRRGVPGSDTDPDEWVRLALFLRQLRELTKRFLEVAIDVVRESLEGRNVQAIDPILEFAPELFRVQLVDDGQERGERLAAPRRRGDEDALPRVDEWH